MLARRWVRAIFTALLLCVRLLVSFDFDDFTGFRHAFQYNLRVAEQECHLLLEQNIEALKQWQGSPEIHLRALNCEKLGQILDDRHQVSLLDLLFSKSSLEVAGEPELRELLQVRVLGGILGE